VVLVDEIDDGRKRRGLSGSGRPGHQHNAIAQADDVLQFCRQIQVGKGRDSAGNYPHHNCAGAALHENVHAEAAGARKTVGDIARAQSLQIVYGMFVAADEVVSNPLGVLTGEGAGQSRGRKFAIDFDQRRFSGREEEVADAGGGSQHRHRQAGCSR